MNSTKLTKTDTLTAQEVAAMLRLAPGTIYSLARDGKIPHFKILSAIRFSRTAVEDWWRSCSRGPVTGGLI